MFILLVHFYYQDSGTVVPSLVTDFYDKKHTSGASQEEEDIVKNVAYTVYGGMLASFQYLQICDEAYATLQGPQIRQVALCTLKIRVLNKCTDDLRCQFIYLFHGRQPRYSEKGPC